MFLFEYIGYNFKDFVSTFYVYCVYKIKTQIIQDFKNFNLNLNYDINKVNI